MGISIVVNTSFDHFVDDIFILSNIAVAPVLAVSMRKLFRDYDGAAIKVRRSSDNTLQDVGFDKNGQLNVTALKNFVGSGDGFVHTLYDQARIDDFVQSDATRQPKIVQKGEVTLENGLPSLHFTGSQILNRLNFKKLLALKKHAISFSVQASRATADGRVIFVPHPAPGATLGGLRFTLAQRVGTFRVTVALTNGGDNKVLTAEKTINDGLFQFTAHTDWEIGRLATSKNSVEFLPDQPISVLSWDDATPINLCSIGGELTREGDTSTMHRGFNGSISEVILFDENIDESNIKTITDSQLHFYAVN